MYRWVAKLYSKCGWIDEDIVYGGDNYAYLTVQRTCALLNLSNVYEGQDSQTYLKRSSTITAKENVFDKINQLEWFALFMDGNFILCS